MVSGLGLPDSQSVAYFVGPSRASWMRVNDTLKIRTILVPVLLADTSRHVLRQAAWLARRLDADVILLHVVPAPCYQAGLLSGARAAAADDLHALMVGDAQTELDETEWPDFEGIPVKRMLRRGDPADEIVKAARELNVGMILMSTHGHGAFYRFLLGSVAAKVLHEVECPVWTGVHLEEATASEFSVRRILCSIDLSAHCHHTLELAASMAAALDAKLTLVHVTVGMEFYGPGGYQVDAVWKNEILGFANKAIASLQKHAGTDADVIIESGDATHLLNDAAKRSNADVLVIGHIPGRSHLGDNGNGYGIISASLIPVLSV